MSNNTYIGIDYSGAATARTRSATIQVYEGVGIQPAEMVCSPSSTDKRKRNWSRSEVATWLAERLKREDRCFVGIDHGFSFPLDYFKRNKLKTWSAFLDDFVEHWPTADGDATVEQFRAESKRTKRTGDSTELRLTEQWTSSAKSVFQFDVQGSVAKSTHAGLPFLKQLRDQNPRLHFWPFDGWGLPKEKSVVAEIYPSLFRNRYPRESRTVDQQDAYSICCWLRDMDTIGRLEDFASPPLTEAQRKVLSSRVGFWVFTRSCWCWPNSTYFRYFSHGSGDSN